MPHEVCVGAQPCTWGIYLFSSQTPEEIAAKETIYLRNHDVVQIEDKEKGGLLAVTAERLLCRNKDSESDEWQVSERSNLTTVGNVFLNCARDQDGGFSEECKTYWQVSSAVDYVLCVCARMCVLLIDPKVRDASLLTCS